MLYGLENEIPPGLVGVKMEEFYLEWLMTPAAKKILRGAQAGPSADEIPTRNYLAKVPGANASAAEARKGRKENLTVEADTNYAPSPPRSPVRASSGTSRQQNLRFTNERLQMQLAVDAQIPRFYFPRRVSSELTPEDEQLVRRVFAHNPTAADLEAVMPELGLSKYLAAPLLARMPQSSDGTVTVEGALRYWTRFRRNDPHHNFFHLVKAEGNDFIERKDLKDCVCNLLSKNPGLEFLQDTAEFQDRYCDTVMSRIMYVLDRMCLGKFTLKELRRGTPDVVATWRLLDSTDDINKVRDFFSYEHFYVLYCKFWELDSDHDFLLDKEDFLKYDGHAFSRKAIDRIFSQIPRPFMSSEPGKMGYDDFMWFLMTDEDKTTEQSMEYFFRLVDLDGDGWITLSEMEYFYTEQEQRFECLDHEVVNFKDVLCQLLDLLEPDSRGFRLMDFKRKPKQSGIFFSMLLSLNKFLAYEQRDPFSIRQDQIDNPGFSDWDRFCSTEYVRLALEDDDQQDMEATTSFNDAAFLGARVDAS